MKLAANLVSRSKGYISLLGTFVLGSLTLLSFEAQAVTCGPFDPSYYRNIDIPVMGPGVATVGQDVEIGTKLHGQSYVVARDSWGWGWKCTVASNEPAATIQPFYRIEAISMPYGPPVLSGNDSVFPTNVPGIGVIITQRMINVNTGGNTQYPSTEYQSSKVIEPGRGLTGPSAGSGFFSIELVKTGPILASGVQQVLGSSFPVLQTTVGVNSSDSFEHVFWTIHFSGVMNFVSKTCLAEDVDVDLGSHQITDFPRVGSVSEWKDFNITLKNCPPFYGYAANSMTYIHDEDGSLTGTNTLRQNSLKMTFSSVHGTNPDNSYIAKTESGPGRAEGFGIQLATPDRSAANISTAGLISYDNNYLKLTLTTNDGANYVIPLKARYYRYGANPKGGKANGAITYTVNYY